MELTCFRHMFALLWLCATCLLQKSNQSAIMTNATSSELICPPDITTMTMAPQRLSKLAVLSLTTGKRIQVHTQFRKSWHIE